MSNMRELAERRKGRGTAEGQWAVVGGQLNGVRAVVSGQWSVVS